MGNSDPEELAQVQLGDIWQSRDVCKCLFDSTAQTFYLKAISKVAYSSH